jgi:ABC-type lipoprotein export system ATPase subunit
MSDSLYLETVGLSKYSCDQKVPLIKDVSLGVKRGEWIAIIGPSSSGKTLLLELIGGLQKPSLGSVRINGQDITQLNRKESSTLRAKMIGYIPQKYELLNYLTVTENVYLPMIFAGHPREIRINRAESLLKGIGLADQLRDHVAELSEGQKQRVAIARALANNPPIVLADEPTSNLDLETGSLVINFLHNSKAQHSTLLCATHDLRIMRLCDRLVWIEKGEITKINEKHDVTFKL